MVALLLFAEILGLILTLHLDYGTQILVDEIKMNNSGKLIFVIH